MTLTFQGYDQSQELLDFFNQVDQAQGFVSHWNNNKRHKALVELIAFVPEQPELLCSSTNPIPPLHPTQSHPNHETHSIWKHI